MELGLGVVVVGEMLSLEPAEQPPLGGGDVAGGPALDRVGDLRVCVDVVDRFGAFERQRRVFSVSYVTSSGSVYRLSSSRALTVGTAAVDPD